MSLYHPLSIVGYENRHCSGFCAKGNQTYLKPQQKEPRTY